MWDGVAGPSVARAALRNTFDERTSCRSVRTGIHFCLLLKNLRKSFPQYPLLARALLHESIVEVDSSESPYRRM
jgi:hypothetical protein